ncbi:MAG TPA: zinc metallopeptidase [bacterium]|jgi:Zn-dependent membrane protease YugP|nr:zinc metallopeptidase [bacterium]
MSYILFVMLPGLLIGLWAQAKLHFAFSKFSQVPVTSGLTGAQAARRILDNAGLNDMPVEEVEGKLSDHYDPTKKALFLSSDNFHGSSIAAVGVAAHEAGHALQHQAAYALLNLRMALVPATQFASYAYMGILLLGFLIHNLPFALWAIVAMFSVITLFQLVTLPVEYDASARAKEQLFRLGLVRETERDGVAKVLNAAALTYVAALVSSMLTLLYYIAAARGSRS